MWDTVNDGGGGFDRRFCSRACSSHASGSVMDGGSGAEVEWKEWRIDYFWSCLGSDAVTEEHTDVRPKVMGWS